MILREETPVESARRARDTAVAELAHELQTPLASQSASLELLRERLARSDSEALDLVLALETGTARLRRLIDNLLESVRIESGQLAIRRVAVDLEEVVEESVAMARPLLERRGQRVALELPHPLAAANGDPQRLAQVLVNLLANASKFGPEGSTVRLGATSGGDAVELWVEDEGPGFPAAAASPVPALPAAPFRRGAIEPRQEGSGLGLWICRSILERHGGSLRVEVGAAGRTRVVARLGGAAGEAA
jgi:signal transduction histidine kinase